MLPEIGDVRVLRRVSGFPALWPVADRPWTRFGALPGTAASPVLIGLLPVGLFSYKSVLQCTWPVRIRSVSSANPVQKHTGRGVAPGFRPDSMTNPSQVNP